MTRSGHVAGATIKLTKTFTLAAGSRELVCEYLLEDLPQDWACHFAIEFNFAGFGAGEQRYLQQPGGRRLGDFSEALEFPNLQACELVDAGLGLRVGLGSSRAAALWAYSVAAVHRCQTGLEASHQGICVTPHWLVRADAAGRWGVTITLPVHYAQAGASLSDSAGNPLHADLGDQPPQLEYPTAQVVTETEVVRGTPEIRRTKTRRLKQAG